MFKFLGVLLAISCIIQIAKSSDESDSEKTWIKENVQSCIQRNSANSSDFGIGECVNLPTESVDCIIASISEGLVGQLELGVKCIPDIPEELRTIWGKMIPLMRYLGDTAEQLFGNGSPLSKEQEIIRENAGAIRKKGEAGIPLSQLAEEYSLPEEHLQLFKEHVITDKKLVDMMEDDDMSNLRSLYETFVSTPSGKIALDKIQALDDLKRTRFG